MLLSGKILALAAVMVLTLAAAPSCAQCRETITVDSVEYEIPDRWCGKKLDSTQLADKTRLVRLPDSLTFQDYRIYVMPAVRDAFVRMADAARRDSIFLIVDSGFRSADFQRRIIKRRLAAGEPFERIARHVAPPGYSRHETGRAIDLVPSEARFAHTPMYRWLKEYAREYGFEETYPEPKGDPDGLWWESWHWEYTAPDN